MIYRQNTIKATITSVSPSATIDRTESAATTIEKNGISIGLTNKNSKNNLMTISKRVQDTP